MKLSTQIGLAFSLIILLSVIDSYTNYVLSLKVGQNTDFLSKSESVIRNSNRLHKSIIEMQSAFRGYLLTDDTSFLEAYHRGKRTVPALFSEQHDLVSHNATQVELLDSIRALHTDWLGYAQSIVDSKIAMDTRLGSPDAYNVLFETRLKKQVGKKLNDEISKKFVDFDISEYRSRNLHSGQLAASISQTHAFSSVFLTLTIIIGITSAVYIVRLITRRIASMVTVAENISLGKFTVVQDNRHDELTGLSESLNIMSKRLNTNIRELQNRNTELNKFAYVVSHDLKAPVRGIHNVVKWIEEDMSHELSADLKQYMQIIRQRTRRMEDLINGLLDYARISEKTIKEEVDVNQLVRELSDTIVPRHFTIEIHELPKLYTERIKLEQVFTNLISNAVKYTPGDNPVIHIHCREIGDHYEFTVADNGIGIDPEYHEKIFEIFQTLREKDEKESTGIGLSIVKKILDELNCTIDVKSSSGMGSAFIFTWPRNQKAVK